MATLSTPSIERINAFDPTENKIVHFAYTGNQSERNRAVITDNDTGKVVYDRTVATLLLSHTIPADVLTAGRQYLIQIQVFDAYNNSSNLSDAVLFYCFTNPTFEFGEISDPYRSASITLATTYAQKEGETLKSYQYKLYDGNKTLLSSSDVFYGDISEYTFYGLQNNTHYYVQCVAITTHDMSLDTGLKFVNVVYNTIPANILFQLENNPCAGYISLDTNLIIIGHKTENDNYKFNPDGSVTLWDNSVTYKGGFSVEGDFSLFIDAKELPFGTFLKTWDDEFTLSIIDVCGAYYCEFKSGDYVLYAELPEAQLATMEDSILVNELGQRIEIVNLSYDNDSYVIFELKRVNNIYSLKTYYRIDG